MTTLLPRRHLIMSGDILGCPNWGMLMAFWWLEASYVLTPYSAQDNPAPNVTSAEVEGLTRSSV